MISVRVPKGFDLPVNGQPSLELEVLDPPVRVAALPERIPFVKPRLKVKIGDAVKIGSVLFEDKRNPEMVFLSPGGGEIEQINFGRRRVIREIVIRLDEEESHQSSDPLPEEALNTVPRDELIRRLMAGGMWPLIRELPFRDIANPGHRPPHLFVCLDSTEPFLPDPVIYLNGKTDLFGFGLKVLQRLAGDAVHICVSRERVDSLELPKSWVTHQYTGRYPAHDPGALLYRLKASAAENRSWFITGDNVLRIGEFCRTGVYPVSRTVVVSGSAAASRRHLVTRIGAPLVQLAGKPAGNGDTRHIAGGLFTGYITSADSYLGLFETALTLIPEGNEKESMALFKPGCGKPTFSRVFASRLTRKPLTCDGNQHGGLRACIACMHCADACPVDILPQLAYKAILAEEVEEYLEHGLLDCVECGLCSWVCPAKIDLAEALKAAKAAYFNEQAG